MFTAAVRRSLGVNQGFDREMDDTLLKILSIMMVNFSINVMVLMIMMKLGQMRVKMYIGPPHGCFSLDEKKQRKSILQLYERFSLSFTL